MSQDLFAGTKTKGSPAYGIWIEPMYFVTLTFDADISSSAFGNANSVLEHALEQVARKATVIGVGQLYNGGTQVDLILGTSQGHTVADPGNSLVIDGFDGVTVEGLDDTGADFSAGVTAVFAKFEGLAAATAADLVADGADGLSRPATARHFK